MAQSQLFCFVPTLHNVLSRSTVDDPSPNGLSSLPAKSIASDAPNMRMSIQKAMVVIQSLPDINRTIEEQKTEIAELEKSIGELRSVKADFALIEEKMEH